MSNAGQELFEHLPAYEGGTAVESVFNCGAGLAVEIDGVTPEDSYLRCIDGTTAEEFLRYCAALEQCGLTLDFAEDNADLLCREYFDEKNGCVIYLYYTAVERRTRIILDRSSCRLPLLKGADVPEQQASTALMQFGLYYNTMERGTTCDCGMCYALRLHDNSLVIIDGGEFEQATDAAIGELIRCLRHMTGTADGEKMVVAAWICTHNHNDHMDVFSKLIRFHSDCFDVRRVMFNFPSPTLMEFDNTAAQRLKTRLQVHYPGVLFRKLHTGQTFSLSNASFEVIATHEDILPDAFDETHLYRGMNETTTILKISFEGQSILFLGDAETRNGDVIRRNCRARGLSCTYLQAAHHGINKVEEIYSFIKAETVLMPQCRYINERSQKENFAVLCRYYGLENVFFAGDCTRIYTITPAETVKEVFPVVGYHYDGSDY